MVDVDDELSNRIGNDCDSHCIHVVPERRTASESFFGLTMMDDCLEMLLFWQRNFNFMSKPSGLRVYKH